MDRETQMIEPARYAEDYLRQSLEAMRSISHQDVAKLIEIERRNNAALNAAREAALAQFTQLEQTGRTLRQRIMPAPCGRPG